MEKKLSVSSYGSLNISFRSWVRLKIPPNLFSKEDRFKFRFYESTCISKEVKLSVRLKKKFKVWFSVRFITKFKVRLSVRFITKCSDILVK